MTTQRPAAAPVTPAGWAVAAVRLATRALPAGAPRDRYRQEFLSELHDLRRPSQAAYACGLLSRTWALRAAVTAPVRLPTGEIMTTRTARKALLCALNLKHSWVIRFTDDGGRFRVCRKCGRTNNPSGTNVPGAGYLMG